MALLCCAKAAPGECKQPDCVAAVSANWAEYASPLRRLIHLLATSQMAKPAMVPTRQKALATKTVATQTNCLSPNACSSIQLQGISEPVATKRVADILPE